MTEIHLTSFLPNSRAEAITLLAKTIAMPDGQMIRADTRKPFLKGKGLGRCGLTITHVRRCAQPFSLMAASPWPNIGIDAEAWSQANRNKVFLDSIMASEEAELAQEITKRGLDAGLFLWVAKEAALKACGHVMVDPRDITISATGANRARASNSVVTNAKIKPANLAFYTFKPTATDETILLATATVGRPRVDHHVLIKAGELPSLEPLNLD